MSAPVTSTVTSGALAWTSVPRWPVPAPALPAAGHYLACWFDDEGRAQTLALLAQASAGVRITTAAFGDRWDADTEQRLRRYVEDCRTGVRIVLAGPEAIVLRASAVARELGATAEELVLIATEAVGSATGYVAERARRRVFCAACRGSFPVVAAMGEQVTCPGCAMVLIVDHRFSRRHAAYFGWPAGHGNRQ